MKKTTGLKICTGTPARLADQFRLLPKISIASRNKVGTVLLISKVPLSTIRSLALDNRSRTSVALLEVLYSKVFPSGIRLETQKPDPDKTLKKHDAGLIIGDQALGYSREGLLVYDLSEEWFNRTGKTFVHAVIAVREGIKAEFIQTIINAKQEGLQSLDQIARAQAKTTGQPLALLLDYLKNQIRYDFGEEEIEGLLHFQSLCHEAGLISKNFPLKFVGG